MCSRHLLAQRHMTDICSVWKPLRGPLEDWPLAVCDQQTVDTTTDLAQSTILHQDYANHNCQVHYNKNQRWFYLSRQQPDEIMIFRQFDSRRPGNNGMSGYISGLTLYLMKDQARRIPLSQILRPPLKPHLVRVSKSWPCCIFSQKSEHQRTALIALSRRC